MGIKTIGTYRQWEMTDTGKSHTREYQINDEDRQW